LINVTGVFYTFIECGAKFRDGLAETLRLCDYQTISELAKDLDYEKFVHGKKDEESLIDIILDNLGDGESYYINFGKIELKENQFIFRCRPFGYGIPILLDFNTKRNEWYD